MGTCNCVQPRKISTDVEVEEIVKSPLKRAATENIKFIRVKSIRFQGDNLHNITKVVDIIENHDKVQLTLNPVSDSKVDITDANSKKIVDSIILEYDITEEEQDKLKNALIKQMFFQDMNDEILYYILT
jgi:hypothetical protein